MTLVIRILYYLCEYTCVEGESTLVGYHVLVLTHKENTCEFKSILYLP